MRWKAERWMKVRHMPAAFRHDPLVRAAQRAGGCWRTRSGARPGDRCWASKAARDAFRRYRAIRAREREYLDWPDPLPVPPPLEGDGPRDAEAVFVPARRERRSA